jgi:hypothetical protein
MRHGAHVHALTCPTLPKQGLLLLEETSEMTLSRKKDAPREGASNQRCNQNDAHLITSPRAQIENSSPEEKRKESSLDLAELSLVWA